MNKTNNINKIYLYKNTPELLIWEVISIELRLKWNSIITI